MSSTSSSFATTSLDANQLLRDRMTFARVKNRHLVLLGTLILLLPNVLFALHLELLPALAMLFGVCGMIILLQQRSYTSSNTLLEQPLRLPSFTMSIILAFALLVFGGEGHLMFANWDWLWRDSVLADLSRAPFPPTYQVEGTAFFLRAPLGMYMLPALAAKATSLGVGHAVLLFQNAMLLALVLYMLAAIARPNALLVILGLLSFSGLDVIGELVMWLLSGHNLSSFVLPSHIENWAPFQYSSVITQLFWVPNHALPSFWLATLVLLCAKGELAIGKLVIALAASLFWSPFAFVGTLPLAAYLFFNDGRANSGRLDLWLASIAAICFLPVALYMKIDAAQVPHEFILFQPFALVLIILFLLIEIPHVVIIREVWDQHDPMLRGVLTVSIVCLVILPTVRVGVANDLVMRASIPSLFFVAFFFAHSLKCLWDQERVALLGLGLMIALIGAVTPAQEFRRSLTFPSFAISDCNMVTVWRAIWAEHPSIENYLARQSLLPPWLIQTAQGERLENQHNTACWQGLPYPPRSNISVMSNAMLLQLGDKAKKSGP